MSEQERSLELNQIDALIDVNNDLRRELDAARKTISELYEENDKLILKVLNSKHKQI